MQFTICLRTVTARLSDHNIFLLDEMKHHAKDFCTQVNFSQPFQVFRILYFCGELSLLITNAACDVGTECDLESHGTSLNLQSP